MGVMTVSDSTSCFVLSRRFLLRGYTEERRPSVCIWSARSSDQSPRRRREGKKACWLLSNFALCVAKVDEQRNQMMSMRGEQELGSKVGCRILGWYSAMTGVAEHSARGIVAYGVGSCSVRCSEE